MRKSILRKAVSLLLALVMVIGLLPTTAFALTKDEAGTDTFDRYLFLWKYPTSAKGAVEVRIYMPAAGSEDMFPSEPATHILDDLDYSYVNPNFEVHTSLQNNDYFDAEDILNGDKVLDDMVSGPLYLSWGIFTDSETLEEDYFTQSFRESLAANETKIIAQTKGISETEALNYEIAWYVVKYLSTNPVWHVDGLIREKNTYSVHYNGNGFTDGDLPSGTINMTYLEAQNYQVAAAGNLARDNDIFVGWNTKADGTGAYFAPDTIGDLTRAGANDITLYAQWRARNTYTVTWRNTDNANTALHVDSVAENTSVVYDGNLPQKAPTQTVVYTFKEWSTNRDPNNPGTTYGYQNAIPVGNSNLTLYAQYTESTRYYTVKWMNGSTLLETDSGMTYDSPVVYNGLNPTKPDAGNITYRFNGWNTEEDGSGTGYGSAFDVQDDLILYAQYEAIPTYTITWKDSDGSVLETDNRVLHGTTPSFDGTTPTKAPSQSTTYTFSGWSPVVAPATGDAVYTANYAENPRNYTVRWYVPHLAASHFFIEGEAGGIVEVDQVAYGSTPTFDIVNGGNSFVHEGHVHYMDDEDANYYYIWNGWEPTIDRVTGDVTYTATYDDVAKTFTGKVNVWLDPTVSGSTVTGGTRKSIEDMLGSGVQLYLLNAEIAVPTASDFIPMTGDSSGYSAPVTVGTYQIWVKGGSYAVYTPLFTQHITVNGGDGSADLLFYTVTYDLNGGHLGGVTADVTEIHRRNAGVKVSDYAPVKDGYDFLGWKLDGSADKQAGDSITVQDIGIEQPHTLVAQWAKAIRADVTVNVTIHHHSDPSSGSEGINPQRGEGTLDVSLTYREAGSGTDYWEAVGYERLSTDWYTQGNTVNTDVPLRSTTTVTSAYTVSGLSLNWEYSANVQLPGYVRVGDPVISISTDSDGNKSYTVDVTMYYWPTLMDMAVQVIADPSIPAELIPTAVDLKFLSWNANLDNDWAPINRHQTATIDAVFARNLVEHGTTYTDAFRVGRVNYQVPVYKTDGTTNYYYRVAVAGFTLPDGTELSASGTDLSYYYSNTNVSGESIQVYVIPLTYADKAYYAEVTVSGGTQNGSMTQPGIYGVKNGAAYEQVGSVTVRVFMNAYDINFDANGGVLKDKNGNAIPSRLENQFRIPELSIPTRDGGYVFDGWYLADGNGNMTDTRAVPADVLTGDVTLIAKWKEPLSFSGQISISTQYTLGGNQMNIPSTDVPASAIVELWHVDPVNGFESLVRTSTVTGIDYDTYGSLKIGVVDYSFTGLPNDGGSYYMLVSARNYEEKFLNESNGDVNGNKHNFNLYSDDGNRAVFGGNNEAIIHAHLIFVPDSFDLTWEVNSSLIGEDSLRPDKLEIVVQYSLVGSGNFDTTTWPIISQHKQGSTYYPETTVLTGDSVTDSYSVWKFHPEGHTYSYSVLVHAWAEGSARTLYDAATAPFLVSYYPDIAYWENGQKSNVVGETNLKIHLTPRQYTITYDSNGGTAIGADTYTWSYGKDSLSTPVREGWDFLGWKLNGSYVTEIDPSVYGNITLQAEWRQQKKITFVVSNGTWADGTGDDITVYVSMPTASVDIKDLVPTGMLPKEGYENGTWGADHALLTGSTVMVSGADPVIFVYHFTLKPVTVSYKVRNPAANTPSSLLMDREDTLYYGSTITIQPNGGTWTHDGHTHVAEAAFQIKGDIALPDPVPGQSNLIFSGWSRSVSGGGYIYTANWDSDENDDDVPDRYQKTVIFRIHNGKWGDGQTADKRVTLNLVNTNGYWSTTGSAVMDDTVFDEIGSPVPNGGYTDGGWQNALPDGNRFYGTNTETFVYSFKTEITYHTSASLTDTAAILPGGLIQVNPNGGSWLSNEDVQTMTVNVPYTLAIPVRGGYTFTGWNLAAGSDGITYVFTANWTLNSYTVTWKNHDGTVLETDGSVSHGATPVYDGATPTRESSVSEDFTFFGWTPEVTPATENAVYTAVYQASPRSYTVTWKNWDGTVLSTNPVQYGAVPSYVGTPTKTGDAQYSYVFTGWDNAPHAVEGDQTYVAQFQAVTNQYTVTWNNWDGTKLLEKELNYGVMPVYDGATPTRTGDARYSYTFDTWTPVVDTVKANVTYTAAYTRTVNQYTITWTDENGNVLSSGKWDYGTTPVYGSTPTKAGDAQYSYTFSGWSPAVNTVVGDQTYRATFNQTVKTYTVTWLDFDGNPLAVNTNVPYGTLLADLHNSFDYTEESANYFYEFEHWYVDGDSTRTEVNLNTTEVDGNVTYRAHYTITPKPSNVTVTVLVDGAKTSVETVTEAGYNLYLVNGAQKVPMNYNGVDYTAKVLPGSYQLYVGASVDTAQPENGHLPQIVLVTLGQDAQATLEHYSVTYNKSNGTVWKQEYYHPGETVMVRSDAPTFDGHVFLNWTDGATVYHSSTNLFPVTLTNNIQEPLVLTAEWDEAVSVTVNAVVHFTNGGYQDTRLELPLSYHLSQSTNGGTSYAEVHGTARSTEVVRASTSVTELTLPSFTYTGRREDYKYSAYASIPGYKTTVTEEHSGSNRVVNIVLQYNPDVFNMVFDVVVLPGEAPNLYPRAVDVKISYRDADSLPNEWTLLPDFASQSMEVSLDASGHGTGTYQALTHKPGSTTVLRYYRVEVVGFDLGPIRGTLNATTSDKVIFSSQAKDYHPDDAYHANIYAVNPDCSFSPLVGVSGTGSNGTQKGVIEVRVNINPYTLVQDPDNGDSIVTTEDLFILPKLDPPASKSGYTFDGWYTKDGGNWDVKVDPAGGTAIMGLDPVGDTLTLYAKWNQNLNIVGTVTVDCNYNGAGLNPYDRLGRVTVELWKVNGSTYAVVDSQTLTTFTDSGDDRIFSYAFSDVANDGSKYFIHVAAPNFDVSYKNEAGVYDTVGCEAVDQNSDSTYAVDVLMNFEPQEFDLEFSVNADAIPTAFRPQSVGVSVLYNNTVHLPPAEQTQPHGTPGWPTIGSALYTVTPGTAGSTVKVLQNHVDGHTYGYAIRVDKYTPNGGSETVYGADAPFDVTYVPNRAWHVANGVQSNELVAVLTPKTYTVTLELRRPGTIAGVAAQDSDTYTFSYTWGTAKTLPVASDVSAPGASFAGWYTKTGDVWSSEPVTEIPAGTLGNDTVYYARWNYTVTWENYDGNELGDGTVFEGDTPVYNGNTPTRAPGAQYKYTFAGWTPAVSPATDNITYRATYNAELRTYSVKWMNGDSELETDSEVTYGNTPTYDGAVPTKASTAQYDYTFAGWSKNENAVIAEGVSVVTGETTYYAIFTPHLRHYTVLWKNGDTVLEEDENVPYGEIPVFNGAAPTKAGNAQYSYPFAGWNVEPHAVEGDQTYTATFDEVLNKYSVIWVNHDGTELETDTDVPYGTTPTYDGATPVRASDAQYSYTFANEWTPAVHAVTGDAVYKAVYTQNLRSYTVTWRDEDGSVLREDTVPYGQIPNYGGTPVKAADHEYTYTFGGWNTPVVAVTGDQSYTATYHRTLRLYTVTYTDGVDGEVIFADQTSRHPYNADTPTYNGGINPSRTGYTFRGWYPNQTGKVTGDATYTAQWELNRYTVKWVVDGVGTETDANVPYGSTPSYDGATPTRAADAQYTYTFDGWYLSTDPDRVKVDLSGQRVTQDLIYVARFTKITNSYTVIWKNGDVVLETDTDVLYGSIPSYGSAVPTKESTAQYSYTFSGWSPAIAVVTGDATYTAQFTPVLRSYTVTYDLNGGFSAETLVYTEVHGAATPVIADPTQDGYLFDGWSPSVAPIVTGNATYVAQWKADMNGNGVPDEEEGRYTVIYTDGVDGETIFADQRTDNLLAGDPTPDFVGTAARSGYLFDGWNPSVASVVTGNATYVAQWKADRNNDGVPDEEETQYTVTYTDGVDSVIVFPDQSTGNLLYGDATPAFAGVPARDGYDFAGWAPAVSATVTGNATYVAQWTENSPAPDQPVAPALSGSAALIKVDANDPDTRLEKATFRLYWLMNEEELLVGTYTTNRAGEILVGELFPGEYCWRELRAPEGYKLDATKHYFTVRNGQTTTMTVTNTHSAVPDVFTREHDAYIIGHDDHMVHPERNTTRAEVATIFFRLLKPEVRSQYLTDVNSFTDVPADRWYTTAVSTIAAMGIINGYPDNSFKPNAPITRAEFAAICARFDRYAQGLDASFADVYGHWAEDEIAIAVANGWLMGYEDGTFHPDQKITRAEVILVINRVMQRIPGSVDDLLPGTWTWLDNQDPNKWYYLAIQEATNSHTYERKTNGREYWTSLTEIDI